MSVISIWIFDEGSRTPAVVSVGHSVVTVANGKEALEALNLAPYELIFMDCQMPEMDAYEATKVIRSDSSRPYRDIPIIAMTANAMHGDREKCLACGMSDYVSKPVKIEDLAKAIERTWRRSQSVA